MENDKSALDVETGRAPPAIEVYLLPIDQSHTGDSLSISQLIGKLWRGRWKLISLAAGGLLLATAVALLVPKTYTAEVLVAAANTEQSPAGLGGLASRFSGLAGLVGLNLGELEGDKNEYLALLRSRQLTDDFIEERQLLPVLFPRLWDSDAGRWKSSDPEDIPSAWKAYRVFDEKIRQVSENKSTGLITVSITLRDRLLAADLANALIAEVNKMARRRAAEEAEASLKYLNDELARTTAVGVQEAIYRLIEAQTNRIMLANVRVDYAFRVLDPAKAPDERRFVTPLRLMIALTGLLAGSLIGGFLVLRRE